MDIQTVPKKPGRPRKLQSQKHFNQITVHLPPDLVAVLDSKLGALGMRSRSELIREACQNYLSQQSPPSESLSLTRRMRDMSKDERHKVMAAAAKTFAEYYRTDPEIGEWQALDAEDFYDIGE